MWSPTYPESHLSGVPLILESHLWLIPSFSNISNFLDRDLAEVVNMASKFYGEFNKICSTSLMRRENYSPNIPKRPHRKSLLTLLVRPYTLL